MLAITTPAPPGAITSSNTSQSQRDAKKTTASTTSAEACWGERPAVWTTEDMRPREAAKPANSVTDSCDVTSTWPVTT